MDQGYVYEDERVEDGLTFKKIGRFFKKGWLIILVSVVAAVLLAAAVALPLKFLAKAEPVGETSIEFIYEGIDKGLDPAGGTLDTDNIISTNVLNDAVKRANLSGVVTDISKLRDYTRVESVLPEDYIKLQQQAANDDQSAINALRNYELHPTRYTIVISDPKKLGLTDAQTVELLDKIVSAYTDDFQKRFSVTNMFDASLYDLSDKGSIEYFDIYDAYVSSLTPIAEYLTQIQAKAPTFVSTGKGGNTTFTTLVSDVSRLKDEYARLNSFLLAKNVWKDPDSARVALESSQAELMAKSENILKYRIEPLKAQIADIKPNSITTTENGKVVTTESYPEEYYMYQSELNELNRLAHSYNEQLSEVQRRLDKISDAKAEDGLLEEANTRIKSLEAKSEALVEKVNATVTDYYDTTFVSSSVRHVAPSVVTRRTISFSLLIVLVAAAIAGLAVGCVINGIVMAKASKKEKAADQKADSENAAE